MKLIIDIPEMIYNMVINTGTFGMYRFNTSKAIKDGTPLDDVKAEIRTERHNLADVKEWGRYYGLGIALEILDNIGKAERED